VREDFSSARFCDHGGGVTQACDFRQATPLVDDRRNKTALPARGMDHAGSRVRLLPREWIRIDRRV